MAEYLRNIAIVIVLLIVYAQAKNWLRWRFLRKWGEQHGCGEAPIVENKLPGGLERYALFFKSWKGRMCISTYTYYNPARSPSC